MSISEVPKSPPGKIQSTRTDWRLLVRALVVLFKLRVVSLLLLAAVGGALLGARGWPGIGTLLLVLLTGFLAASGASALNQYWEMDSDSLMGRTRSRPLVTGGILRERWIPYLAGVMILTPVLAVLPFNRALAFYLLLGAFIYVGIYTIWLKPRTLLNIVIGGAAGSAAVMSGAAAVGAASDPAAIALALLVFLWTPSHFWSLAILYRNDYQKAGTPMLPARTSTRAAGYWVLLHTAATGLVALALGAAPTLGWLYFIPVVLATAHLFRRNVQLIREPSTVTARAFFMSSNVYLTVVLVAMMADVLLPF